MEIRGILRIGEVYEDELVFIPEKPIEGIVEYGFGLNKAIEVFGEAIVWKCLESGRVKVKVNAEKLKLND